MLELFRTRKASGPFSGFKHKTATLKELAVHGLNLAVSPSNLYGILISKRFDPAFREEIMVAIATLNACKYCNYAHHDFALQAGVSKEDLMQLEGVAPENFDEKKFLAITYARELANRNFTGLTPALVKQLKEEYTAQERGDIQTTARIIMLFSMICNTSDAFLSRLGGEPAEDSRTLDEAIVAALFFGGILPVVGLYLSVSRGQNPIETLSDFIHFSDNYTERRMSA
ncbi:hypothetical protein CRM90_29080 [Mycobacterium sp. ENV421]|uniref:carboxymuconolactone decarboxylase family protein n=1 Tax=Mycobacterium sp. ENV421 TaxID=1213407 RepID=UPI000C9B42A3|nr:carboxymuconolactone decarboxylase family protein [Mycobacterium sp. ENV421]PND54232.1 hypothetical protein CRM90_29080 [Mycobacterium sp. ENV421]